MLILISDIKLSLGLRNDYLRIILGIYCLATCVKELIWHKFFERAGHDKINVPRSLGRPQYFAADGTYGPHSIGIFKNQ